VPFVHVAVQQSGFPPQALPEAQCPPAAQPSTVHDPAVHTPEPQAAAAQHLLPPTPSSQALFTQLPEQHWAAAEQ